MGIFDSLKSIIKKERVKKPIFTKQEKDLRAKINFSEIHDFVEKSIEENKQKEKLLLEYFKEKEREFIQNIENQIEILRNIDLEHKKAKTSERVKSIVNENKEKYIQYTEEIIKKLKNIQEENIEEFINKRNKIFEEFYKKSYINYEKATVLIGKEIADIRNTIKYFSNDILKTYNKNKDLINKINIFNELKENCLKFNEKNLEINNIHEKINSLEKDIYEKEREKKKILDNIEETKNSKEYNKRLEKQEQIKYLEKQINNLIIDLKQKINFKELANFFHVFPKKIKIVKDYKENFLKKFKENRQEIISFLEEAKMKTSEISEVFEEIKNKEDELQKTKKELPEDKTIQEYNKLDRIDKEINDLNNEKSGKEKRKERIQKNKQNLKNSLKSDLNKISVELKD